MNPATAYLYQLLTGNALSQPVSVAAKLGIADLLASGPRTAQELAASTGTHADSLYRLLRALATLGLFAESANRRFELTDAGRLLQRDIPGSLHALAVVAGAPWRAVSYDLLDCIKSGESAFEKRFGSTMYRYFEANPDEGAAFNAVQASHAGAIDLAATVDWEGAHSVVDVGGGTGGMLCKLLAARPELKGVLFDLPVAVQEAQRDLKDRGLAERLRVVGGDFFEEVPGGGDVYLLCFVLHNWDDERAARILSKTAVAMRAGAKLLVVESVMPQSNPSHLAALLDLEMLVFTSGGRERTEKEYRALLETAGFEVAGARATGTTASVLEAFKRELR